MAGWQLSWLPGRGIASDIRGRLPYYRDDWVQGCNWGSKVFAPATYIFFASALPALAFGQQLAMDTGGTLTVVHVLISTALAGLVQSILGGQPLLIIGVAEPIVLIYGFMFRFCTSTPGLGAQLFLPWAAWVCVWTAVMCLVLALANACSGIDRFTRFSGELFGALIAILFLQVGVKGIVHEFQPIQGTPTTTATPTSSSSSDSLLVLINGLWGLFLACGLLFTSLKLLTARSWLIGRGWLRGFLADYGVPLLVICWSAASFAVRPAAGVPRRVDTPNTWEVNDHWSVAGRMWHVPGPYIAVALLPALIISILFYFDHNVSSQLAQQTDFNLRKPPAYHYDFLLLAALTLVCGLLGLPPVNGVLPQAPMHTRSLAHIRKCKQKQHTQQQHKSTEVNEVDGRRGQQEVVIVPVTAAAAAAPEGSMPVQSAVSSISAFAGAAGQDSSSHHTAAGDTLTATLHGAPGTAGHLTDNHGRIDAHQQQQQQHGSGELRHRHHQPQPPQQQQQQGKSLKETSSEAQVNTLPDSSADGVLLLDNMGGSIREDGQDPHQEGNYLQLEVREQRVSGLIQSILLCVCLGITPAIQLIPTAVLWGYFVFMAVDSLTGSQLWERTRLIVTDPKKRLAVMQQQHAAYLQLVPYRVVVRFTLLQLVYLLGVWALTTWAGVAGVAFPLPIMALVPVRQYLLPRVFKKQHLAQLDAASYEEAPPILDKIQAEQELVAVGALPDPPTLPVTADSAAGGGVAVDESVTAADDEACVLQQEFAGYQLKHHLTTDELEKQRSR